MEDELESRTTPIQEGEDDEDITSTDMNTPLAAAMNDVQGPITRARARQLNYQVNSFLGVNNISTENPILPKTCDFLVLRNHGEEEPTHGKRNTLRTSPNSSISTNSAAFKSTSSG